MSAEMVAAAAKNIFPWADALFVIVKANNTGREVPDEARLWPLPYHPV